MLKQLKPRTNYTSGCDRRMPVRSGRIDASGAEETWIGVGLAKGRAGPADWSSLAKGKIPTLMRMSAPPTTRRERVKNTSQAGSCAWPSHQSSSTRSCRVELRLPLLQSCNNLQGSSELRIESIGRFHLACPFGRTAKATPLQSWTKKKHA